MPKKTSSGPQWLRDLRKRKEPMPLRIDSKGYIEAWRYSYDGPHDYNLMIGHPEGDLDLGIDNPTLREHYIVDNESFKRLSYEAQKARLLQEIEFCCDGHLIEEGLPWDDTEVGMNTWLDQNDHERGNEPGFWRWHHPYCVGYPIHDALTTEERETFGIREVDIGELDSDGFIVVEVECTMDALNEIIRRKKLPFLVVEDWRG
jgi:hypothetical protein